MSIGLLGKTLSIAILLLAIHRAQAKPAKKKKPRCMFVPNILESLLPCRSYIGVANVSHPKALPKLIQTKRASEQEKKIWLVVSSFPHRQQEGSPFHPLCIRATPDHNLGSCRMVSVQICGSCTCLRSFLLLLASLLL